MCILVSSLLPSTPTLMASSQRHGITRNRERLACSECRRRKLRCDRAVPCGACTRRGGEDGGIVCSYQRFAGGLDDPGAEAERRGRMEARLDHLEHMVQSVQTFAPQQSPTTQGGLGGAEPGVLAAAPDLGLSLAAASSSSSAPSLNMSPEDSLMLLQIAGSNSAATSSTRSVETQGQDPALAFHGATHWAAALDDIRELRLAMFPDEDPEDEVELDPAQNGIDQVSQLNPADSGIGLLFGSSPAPATSLDYVLAVYLPPRQQVDRLTSAYFRAQSLAAPFIHAKHFNRLYQAFWEDSGGTSPLWISLLFSICHVAVNTLRQGTQNSSQQQGAKDMRFSVAAAHCLAIGQYFRPQQFAVEGLLLYIHSQCLTTKILSPDLAPVLGVLIRTATMMGYHQDLQPSRSSVFVREMRRRTWSLCMQLELLISFHLGLPSSIHSLVGASKAPTSLSDNDFDEDTAELPPAKPDFVVTGIMFNAVKHRFMMTFSKILAHALTAKTQPATYSSEVDALDAEMRQTFESLPSALSPRPMSESVFDPPSITVTRLCTLFLYCKCLCVLHRPGMLAGRPQSLRACHDAASRLVRGFTDGYAEFGSGGQVETEGWFLSSLTWHDFLLGAVTLSLAALAAAKGGAAAEAHAVDLVEASKLLARARDVCAEQGPLRGRETARVESLLDATLRRLGSAGPWGQNSLAPIFDFSVKENGRNPALEDMFQNAENSLWGECLEQFLDVGKLDEVGGFADAS